MQDGRLPLLYRVKRFYVKVIDLLPGQEGLLRFDELIVADMREFSVRREVARSDVQHVLLDMLFRGCLTISAST